MLAGNHVTTAWLAGAPAGVPRLQCRRPPPGERGIGVLVRILHRGDRLFDHGEPFDSVYMVRSGTLKTCTVSASGEEQVIGFHGPGDLAGLDAIHEGRHTSSAIALGNRIGVQPSLEPSVSG